MAQEIFLTINFDVHDELIRQANLLALSGNFNSYDLLKRNLGREIARLQREESYIVASDSEKRSRHYEECVPISDEGSMATYLTTLSRVCECVIAALPYEEAQSMLPVTVVDKKIVVPVSAALDVLWLRAFRLMDVYRGALPSFVSTKIDYSHIFEAPDMSRSVCAPRISYIDEIVDRWCVNITEHGAELLRRTMTDLEFSNKLRLLFWDVLVLDDTIVCIDDIPFEVDDQYVCVSATEEIVT